MNDLELIHIRICVNKSPEEVMDYLKADQKLHQYGPGDRCPVILMVPEKDQGAYLSRPFREVALLDLGLDVIFADRQFVESISPEMTVSTDAIRQQLVRSGRTLAAGGDMAVCLQRIEHSADRPVRGKQEATDEES